MQKRMIRETLSTSIKIIKFRHHSGFQFFFFKGGGGERVKKEKTICRSYVYSTILHGNTTLSNLILILLYKVKGRFS